MTVLAKTSYVYIQIKLKKQLAVAKCSYVRISLCNKMDLSMHIVSMAEINWFAFLKGILPSL